VRLLVASDEDPEIPDLLGVPYQEALEQLESLGLTPEAEGRRPRDGEQPGTVVELDPDPGTEVQLGTTVRVVVAVDSVEVPEVSGMSLDDARATLEQAGLAVGRVIGSDNGNVVFTAPGAGSEVDVGSEVSLIMAGGRRGRD
jgi:eukaryotic-like serine/threonine-protein kinase